ncbi:hypothetical protein CHS0354_024578, partial [Potamilus streckersoni]
MPNMLQLCGSESLTYSKLEDQKAWRTLKMRIKNPGVLYTWESERLAYYKHVDQSSRHQKARPTLNMAIR